MDVVTPVDYRAIWDYEAMPLERLSLCPLCGYPATGDLLTAERDRYGYPQFAEQCEAETTCGLVYLNPRMTKEAYAEFYASGAYRRLVSAFHGREINAETIEVEQGKYAIILAELLQPWVKRPMDQMLDIGGSTGTVASVLERWLGLVPTILEPSEAEGRAAESKGYMVIPYSLENFDPPPGWDKFDLVTMCQTADHLLDLMGSLKKIRGLLSTGGLFWSDIVDFDVTKEVKIDHPFNLTERTYRAFLAKAGFKLLQVNYAEDGKHIGFLTKAAE